MLLKDAAENYPAWLDAIDGARRTICLEMYIVHGDDQGHLFDEALERKAREGVKVRVLFDWLGGLGRRRFGFWSRLRAAGGEVAAITDSGPTSPSDG